jgi:hypothetical protein
MDHGQHGAMQRLGAPDLGSRIMLGDVSCRSFDRLDLKADISSATRLTLAA